MTGSFAEECVRRALQSAAVLRGGAVVTVDPDHVEVAFRSERHLRLRGERIAGFAPLSRFWPSADGWVRTHANYPWHQAALLAALGVESSEPAVVAAAIARWPSRTVEDRVYAAGGLAVAVRTAEQWRRLPRCRGGADRDHRGPGRGSAAADPA